MGRIISRSRAHQLAPPSLPRVGPCGSATGARACEVTTQVQPTLAYRLLRSGFDFRPSFLLRFRNLSSRPADRTLVSAFPSPPTVDRFYRPKETLLLSEG